MAKYSTRERSARNREILVEWRRTQSSRTLDRLVAENEGLINKIASRYWHPAYACDLEDLAQAGRLGLVHAATKFDLERGVAFSTYATPWIRQAVVREVETQSNTIRIPTDRFYRHLKLRRLSDQMESELLRKPSSEELAAPGEFSLAEIEKIRLSGRADLSLDYWSRQAESGASLEAQHSAGDGTDRIQQRAAVGQLLQELPPLEHELLYLLYWQEETLESAGKLLYERRLIKNPRPTRQWLSQLKQAAIERLRHRLRQADPEDTAALLVS